MAREFYGYFDSIDDDVREYDAAQFAHILKAAVQSGVSSHEGGLEVTADGRTCTRAWRMADASSRGTSTSWRTTGATPSPSRTSPAARRTASTAWWCAWKTTRARGAWACGSITGTPSASPQPPALTRNAQVWELSLAQVRVRASATAIAPEDVTDERGDGSACGYAVPRRLDRALAALTLNTLTATEPGYALDARQGKVLGDRITRLSAEAARTATYAATLTASGWSASAPYQQTVSAEGILATDDPFVTWT